MNNKIDDFCEFDEFSYNWQREMKLKSIRARLEKRVEGDFFAGDIFEFNQKKYCLYIDYLLKDVDKSKKKRMGMSVSFGEKYRTVQFVDLSEIKVIGFDEHQAINEYNKRHGLHK